MPGIGSIYAQQEDRRVNGPVRAVERVTKRLLEEIRTRDLENALLRDEIRALREQLNRATGA